MSSVAVVDGYSTGNYLPPAFARLGLGAVHLLSTPEPRPGLQPPILGAYEAEVVYAGTVEEAAAALGPYRPVAVLAGSEPGVPLADALSERLGLPSNGSALSAARRDKHRMVETVRAAGLRCARQLLSANPDEIAVWAKGEGWPVVVKPISAASTQGVSICVNAADVLRAAQEVLGSTDIFGSRNTYVLVQSYLAGTEYVVDTVAADGRRYVCAVWEYEKTTTDAGRPVYDRMVLVDPDAPEIPELVRYTDGVLDALGIRHGPAHTEVMLTPAGPSLVEVGARLNGAMRPGFDDLSVEINMADATALAYARPDEFAARYGGRVYRQHRHAAVYFTRTRLDGVVESVDEAMADRIRSLPTVSVLDVRLRPGQRIQPTIDLMTSPLRLHMVDADPAALRADQIVVAGLADRVYRVVAPA